MWYDRSVCSGSWWHLWYLLQLCNMFTVCQLYHSLGFIVVFLSCKSTYALKQALLLIVHYQIYQCSDIQMCTLCEFDIMSSWSVPAPWLEIVCCCGQWSTKISGITVVQEEAKGRSLIMILNDINESGCIWCLQYMRSWYGIKCRDRYDHLTTDCMITG